MTNRSLLEHLFRQAVVAVDPYRAVMTCLQSPSPLVFPDGTRFPASVPVRVFGLGKAAPAMALAGEELLGDRISSGLIVSPYPVTTSLRRMRCIRGGHPLPDADSLAAGYQLIRLAASDNSPALVLVSGGGSACAVAPRTGLEPGDKALVTDQLLRSGADIREINTVRRHLSLLKNGGLLRALGDSPVLTLALSDVIGDDLSAIASGPTLPDSSTPREALGILRQRGIFDCLPDRILAVLDREPDPVPDESRHCCRMIGSNRMAVEAAAEEAKRLGLSVWALPEPISGEAREVGRTLAELDFPGDCLIAGGETTVTVRGNGRGGRNQELALGFLAAGPGDRSLLAAGTDGIDGPTEAAGGFADEPMLQLARMKGLDPDEFLGRNDAHSFLSETGGLYVTGPTGTNVCDLVLVLKR
jgi:glycerate 2-kinase